MLPIVILLTLPIIMVDAIIISVAKNRIMLLARGKTFVYKMDAAAAQFKKSRQMESLLTAEATQTEITEMVKN